MVVVGLGTDMVVTVGPGLGVVVSIGLGVTVAVAVGLGPGVGVGEGGGETPAATSRAILYISDDPQPLASSYPAEAG